MPDNLKWSSTPDAAYAASAVTVMLRRRLFWQRKWARVTGRNQNGDTVQQDYEVYARPWWWVRIAGLVRRKRA